MGLVTIPTEYPINAARTGTLVGYDLNASNRFVAAVGAANLTATVNRAVVFAEALTGTSPTYRVGIEGVSGNLPNGVYKGATNNAYADTSLFSAGVNQIVLNESWTPAANEAYAVTIRHQTGTINGSNFRRFRVGYEPMVESNVPHGAYGDGSTTIVRSLPCMTAMTTGNQYLGPAAIIGSLADDTWNNSGTPLYRGGRVQPTSGYVVDGFDFVIAAQSGGHFRAHFLMDDNPTPLETRTFTAGTDILADSTPRLVQWRFPNSIIMPSRSVAVFMLEPTTSTAITMFRSINLANASALTPFRGSFAMVGATTGTLGSYTLSVLRVPPVRMILSGFEVPGVFFG